MILRDLVTRLTFKTDTSQLKKLDGTLGGLKRRIGAISAIGIAAWAVRTGSGMFELELQLKSLTKTGFGPISKAIDKLRAKGKVTGLPSIFAKVDLLQAAVSLRKAGLEGKELIDMLNQAALLLPRAGGSIAQVASRLGEALTKGGLSEYLRELGVIGLDTQHRFEQLENQISTSAGIESVKATREYRRLMLSVLAVKKEVFAAEQEEMIKGEVGAKRRLEAAAKTAWTQLAQVLTTQLVPVLNQLSSFLDALGFGKKPKAPSLKLGADGGELPAGASPLMGDPYGLGTGQESFIDEFWKKKTRRFGYLRGRVGAPVSIGPGFTLPGGQGVEKTAPQVDAGQKTSAVINWYGNINLTGGANDIETVRGAVRQELGKAVLDLLPAMEGGYAHS